MKRRSFGPVSFETESGPASAAEVQALESFVGSPLPEDVAAFFRSVNGGVCDYELSIPEWPCPICFSYWHTIGEVVEEVASLEDAYFRTVLPEAFLPLALTGGEDDCLLVDLTPSGHGQIYVWLTGRPPGWRRPTDDQLVNVAPSFTALLERLRESDDA